MKIGPLLLLASFAVAQIDESKALHLPGDRKLVLVAFDGGPNITNLGYNIRVNDKSSLRRKWVVINDPTCPVQISHAGIETVVDSGISGYAFRAKGEIVAKDPISAYTVTFVIYDPFGERIESLGLTRVQDLEGSQDLGDKFRWTANENDVSEYLSSVVFVRKVLTKAGKAWSFSEKDLLGGFKAIDLQIKPEEMKATK